jgi:hypothetical protein
VRVRVRVRAVACIARLRARRSERAARGGELRPRLRRLGAAPLRLRRQRGLARRRGAARRRGLRGGLVALRSRV